MEGLYNKENLFAEFKMQKTNTKKVSFLKEMKELKITHPDLFKGTEISLENFDNLIAEWSKKEPWVKIGHKTKLKKLINKEKMKGYQHDRLFNIY